jgi:pimeloyl-[acyl-carrier protein] methyl ester esterase
MIANPCTAPDPALPVVFAPGWGFAPRLWDGLCGHLQDVLAGRLVHVVDVWNEETFSLPPRFIGVGHSLGAVWLMRHHGAQMQAFVAIAGFTRFPVAARVLARMRTQFTREPQAVLATFHARCVAGMPNSAAVSYDPGFLTRVNDHSYNRLLQGLDWLANWEAVLPACPVLALHGAADVIVSVADALRQWPSLVRCPDAPHALPLTHPDWCAARMREFLLP